MGQPLQPFPHGPYVDEVTGAPIVEIIHKRAMSQFDAILSHKEGRVGLTRSSTLPIPNWTIIGKSNKLPAQ
jgi:hypothetical protein